MKNLAKLILASLVVVSVIGCKSEEATIAESTVKNAETGETEGKEPTFVMVPSQKDPNAPAKN